MNKAGFIFIILSLLLGSITNADTVAYWQIDDWEARTIFKDAIGGGTYDLTKHSGHQQADGFVAANPIPNPDPGPFNEGQADTNTISGSFIRGNTPSPVSIFNMTSSSSWTFEGWFYWTGSTESGYLAGTRGVESNWAGWELAITSTGRIDLRMFNSTGSYVGFNSGANTLNTNTWYHIAVVWDHDGDTNGLANIYIDGLLVGSGNGLGTLGGGAKAFYIGGRDKTADGIYKYTEMEFSGYMDELRFSNHPLSPSQFLMSEISYNSSSSVRDVSPDLNWDRIVDLFDLSSFAEYWLDELIVEPPASCGDDGHPYPIGDMNLDCTVDDKDLVIILSDWLDKKYSGLDVINTEKSSLWDSEDTDWTKWAVNHVSPTRIYLQDWTDQERLDYVQDFDPDVAGMWGGVSMNRGEFLRMRGIAEISGSEYEFQESIGPMNGFAELIFTDNGLAVKEDGSVALRAPWYVPYMTVTAPKWRETISQGISRMAIYGDGVFQDNIVCPIDGVGDGNFSQWENFYFVEYLKETFSDTQLTWMGITDVNNFQIRDYLADKRTTLSGEDLILDPVLHEYIRFNYIDHLRIWVNMADRAKRTANKMNRPVPVLCGHQSGGWGPRAYGLPQSDKVDVIRMEQSFLRQPCFYNPSQMQAESTITCKSGLAGGHFERPVWVTEFIERHFPDNQLRVPTAVVLSEIQANGCVPVQGTSNITEQDTPRWNTQIKHSQFISQNRHLFTDRQSAAKIALVQSIPSLFWRDFASLRVAQPHYEHMCAAARFLEDNHLMYDVMMFGHPDLYDDTKNLNMLTDYEMVILPDVDCISDHHVEKLSEFVTDGGKLVLWREVGTRDEEMYLRDQQAFAELESNPGLGQVITISAGLADTYFGGSSSAEAQILSRIEPDERVMATALPDSVWANVWQYGAGPMRAVHLINYDVDTQTDSVTAVANFTVDLKCPDGVTYSDATYYTPDHLSGSSTIPSPAALTFTQQNGYVQVQVPELKISGVIVLTVTDELQARASAAQLRKWYERLKLACRSRGQDISDYSTSLNEAENLLSQIQGNVTVTDFTSMISALNQKASELQGHLQAVTNAVEQYKLDLQNAAINAEAVHKFDFGYSGNPAGWQTITAAVLYSSARGYGWTDVSFSEVRDKLEPDLLHRDFMRSKDPVDYVTQVEGNNQFPLENPDTHPVSFRVDVPNGDYIVTIVTGDYSEMAMNNGVTNEGRVGSTYVKINGKSYLYGDRLYTGYFQNRSFPVTVGAGYLELTFWGQNVGPMYHNSIEWLMNGLIIQTTAQDVTDQGQEYLDRAGVLNQAAVRDWYVIGPFDDDDCRAMETSYGPEQDADTDLTWPGKGGTVSWQLVPTLTGIAPYIDFSALLSDNDEVAAYCLTNVYCPNEMTAKLICSASQTAIGWVNGSEVLRDEISAGLLMEEENVSVQLQQGWNKILVKTVNHWGSHWAFHMSILDESDQPLVNSPGVLISAETPE